MIGCAGGFPGGWPMRSATGCRSFRIRLLPGVVHPDLPAFGGRAVAVNDFVPLDVFVFCDELHFAEDKDPKSLTPMACG